MLCKLIFKRLDFLLGECSFETKKLDARLDIGLARRDHVWAVEGDSGKGNGNMQGANPSITGAVKLHFK